jgi:glycine/sarcosine/dimethylglycine N-methyltransferase
VAGGERICVLKEVVWVLAARGEFSYTDPIASDGCNKSACHPILERLHLEPAGSSDFYQRELNRLGMNSITLENNTTQLVVHYGRVLDKAARREAEVARAGNLAWGIHHARS